MFIPVSSLHAFVFIIPISTSVRWHLDEHWYLQHMKMSIILGNICVSYICSTATYRIYCILCLFRWRGQWRRPFLQSQWWPLGQQKKENMRGKSWLLKYWRHQGYVMKICICRLYRVLQYIFFKCSIFPSSVKSRK